MPWWTLGLWTIALISAPPAIAQAPDPAGPPPDIDAAPDLDAGIGTPADDPIAEDPYARNDAARASVVALRTLHHDNQTEMALAQLAMERATRPEVRRYARRLFRDHRIADDRVADVAQQLGISLDVLPLMGPDDPRQVRMRELLLEMQQLEGEAFDHAYLEEMVRSHRHHIRLLAGLRRQADAEEVRALITLLVPILEQHLQLGRSLLTPRPVS